MSAIKGYPGLVPYPLIFPDAEEGVVGLSLPVKVGKVKVGDYSFVEAYCVDAGCDCRRTVLLVLDSKGKQAAVIEFGFDPYEPLAGPYLDEYVKQSAAAEDLLQIFVDLINEHPEWLKGMYRHYRAVRKKVDGRSYRGRPFPKPGATVRVIKPPEESEDPFAAFSTLLSAAVRTPPMKGGTKKNRDPRQGSLFAESRSAETMDDFIDRIAEEQEFAEFSGRQSQLREFLSRHDDAPDNLARTLVELYRRDNDHRLELALRLLRDILDILRTDLERRRPELLRRMEDWQAALARHVYAPGVNPELGAYVTQALLDTRVEVLPLLHEANSRRMLAGLEAEADFVADPEQAMLELLNELEQEGVATPHEFFEAILQMTAVGDAEVQINLCRLMLGVAPPVVREAAVLMLFHPQAEVRAGVAQTLAELSGEILTPASLRRLIVARNWFPETLRGRIDQAIANARKARVECAPLPRRVEMTIYASAVDGAMAQTFQVLVPEGKGFLCCSIMPKKGFGVADAFLLPLAGKRERNEFLAMLRTETGAVEAAPDYLDRRVCQALADGAAQGRVPPHWLVAIAERLGRDQWKAVPLDVAAELAALRVALSRRGGRFVTGRYRQQALEAAAAWTEDQPFAFSWFEDDVEVDEVMEKVLGKRRRIDPDRFIKTILDKILQPRRAQWLERLVLTALWLKAAKKPPVPWEQMFYVAEAVADEKVPLAEIPLMYMVAGHSFGAWVARQEDGKT